MKQISCTIFILVMVLSQLTGCGDGRPQRFPVAGTLIVGEKQFRLPDDFEGGVAAIGFYPREKGRACYANIEADGTFVVGNFETDDGMPLGTYDVEVQIFQTVGEKTRRLIPMKYESVKTSGLVTTIGKETTNITLELEARK